MSWFAEGITFALGVGSSIVASYVYSYLRSMRLQKQIRIEGNWLEYVPDSKGHQFSFGRIYFDKSRRIYAFDGTNYSNSGKKYCYWDTVTSYVDVRQRKFFYTFTAHLEGALDVTYYGFGVVNLDTDRDGFLVPHSGHYVSANVDGAPMSHTMQKIDKPSYRRSAEGNRVIVLVKRPGKAKAQ